ncbi:MAG: DUF1552 domain-containing protein [Planctomycetes bacterium]|nr:DUF1552 domain-containing protein [Planctomycetota bacterium]
MNIQRKRWTMDRRTFLRGTGVAIALPWLEAMGVNSGSYSKAGELAPSEITGRAVFTCWGLGMNPFTSMPEKTGLDYVLPESVKPLQPFQKDTTYFTGLHAVTGGHQSAHCFLTGVDPHKGGKYGISCDQIIADTLGGKTRFPSLSLSHTRQTGFGGDGQHTLSWNKNRTPIMPEDRPQILFDKLFRPDSANEVAAQKVRSAEQGSILDSIREQAKRLEGRLGASDKIKLQEYLTSIRDLEEQMATDARWLAMPKPKVDPVDYAKAQMGWFKSMFDVTALALQTDSTRLVAFNVRSDLGGYAYKDQNRGVPWDLHTITHNNGEEEKLKWWTKVDAWQMEEWVYFLNKLKGLREGTGSVLDHTLALWGTTNGGPAAHSKQDLPAMLTGGTRLGIKHAGHVACGNQVPLGNLMRTVTEKMGVTTNDRFYGGAHSGVIKELS